MAIFGGQRINADPKTPSQLRAALAAAQQQSDDLTDDVAAVTADVSELAGLVGPVSAVFNSTAAIGQPVYVAAAGQVDLADADLPATAGVVGLVSTGAASAATGEYITHGTLTQADWTTVTGGASLTAGSLYWLSGTTGQVTTTAPSTGVVVRCGRALTATTMLVAIEPGVRL